MFRMPWHEYVVAQRLRQQRGPVVQLADTVEFPAVRLRWWDRPAVLALRGWRYLLLMPIVTVAGLWMWMRYGWPAWMPGVVAGAAALSIGQLVLVVYVVRRISGRQRRRIGFAAGQVFLAVSAEAFILVHLALTWLLVPEESAPHFLEFAVPVLVVGTVVDAWKAWRSRAARPWRTHAR